MPDELPWWKTGIVYQIYPRSFQDADGDGVGDLEGIRRRLDHLADLGVDALWLSPISPSPQADFGYDIADYCDVDPLFGDLDGFRRLVAEARERGLRVVMDLVVNHTSDRHPWFVASRSSRADPKRDWYVWRDAPNNWASVFGGSAWQKDEPTGQYYLHTFLPEQPDLNWRNPEVRQAVLDAMAFWRDLGVEGFRLDVYNCWFKDAAFRDNPRRWNPVGLVYGYVGQRHVFDRDQPELHAALRRMNEGTFLVGETLDETARYDNAAQYVEDIDLVFHFRLLHAKWGARAFGEAIRATVGKWPTWVQSNHDFPRQATRHGDDEARSKLLAMISLTLRGTPFLYYGEEIGMAEGRIARRDIVDPPGKRFWPFFKGRDGCRTPMQWTAEPHAGFTTGTPWLPVNPDFASRNVAAQAGDPDSVLGVYKRLIALRRRLPALHAGDMVLPPHDDRDVLTWRRDHAAGSVRVVLDLSRRPARFALPEGGGTVLFARDRAREGQRLEGEVTLDGLDGMVLLVPPDRREGQDG